MTDTVVVQSCFNSAEPTAHACFASGKTASHWIQTLSTDRGRSFSALEPIKPATPGALGPAREQGMTMGQGRGLQLCSSTNGKAGRLLFCAHAPDTAHGTVAPVWRSDDHGATYLLRGAYIGTESHNSPLM